MITYMLEELRNEFINHTTCQILTYFDKTCNLC